MCGVACLVWLVRLCCGCGVIGSSMYDCFCRGTCMSVVVCLALWGRVVIGAVCMGDCVYGCICYQLCV